MVALVYADYEALDSLRLNNPDNLKTIMDENLKNLNNSVAAYEKSAKSSYILQNLKRLRNGVSKDIYITVLQ